VTWSFGDGGRVPWQRLNQRGEGEFPGGKNAAELTKRYPDGG